MIVFIEFFRPFEYNKFIIAVLLLTIGGNRIMNLQQIFTMCMVIVLIVLFYLVRRVHKIEERVAGSGRQSAASASPKPVVEGGIPQEVVAAISAAVYTLYPNARISRVRRSDVKTGSSAWKTAGLLENTRPF